MVFGRIYASDADRCSSDNSQLRQSGCRQGDQAVAGQPDAESGEVDEGPTGPNSRAGSDRN